MELTPLSAMTDRELVALMGAAILAPLSDVVDSGALKAQLRYAVERARDLLAEVDRTEKEKP